MPVPDFPFLADDIYWPEVPIILWLVCMTAVMIVLNFRFGWNRAREMLVRRRVLLVATFVVALVLAAVLHGSSGQQMPMYF